jgi:hypothetical protein
VCVRMYMHTCMYIHVCPHTHGVILVDFYYLTRAFYYLINPHGVILLVLT